MERTGGLILCGGRSSRMGQDKAALRLPSGTALQRALDHMLAVARPVVVSLAAGASAPPLPAGVRAVLDGLGEQGPLQGLLEGFRALAGEADRVVVMAVDMPFFSPMWMQKLLDGLAGRRACLYRWEGFANGLTAAYRLDLLPKLERLAAEGRRRPVFLSEDEPTRIIVAEEHWQPGQGPPPLMDMDTPEDYRRVLLWEGIGNSAGAPVSVQLPPPGGAAPATGDELHLYAATPAEVVDAVAQLFPEWRTACRGGGASLLTARDGPGGWEPATDKNLFAGQRLRIRFLPGGC